MQVYQSVNQYKERLASDWMQQKNYNTQADSLNQIQDSYQKQKEKLEVLKNKLDQLMQEIEAWSQNRKLAESNTQQQKADLEDKLQQTIQERSSLKQDMEKHEESHNEQIDNIIQELDQLREQISEKKRINKALKIREELINFRINPMKRELSALQESKLIFEENWCQLTEVYSQCYEEYQMSNEDKVGKMISRVDLVAEIEEYEELIENIKNYYSVEEVNFIMKYIGSEDPVIIQEFGEMRVFWFLKDICASLKSKIQEDQDLEASMLSEMEFKTQTQTFDKLEELETIITKRLPILSQDEIIQAMQSICDLMEIKIQIKAQVSSIFGKAGKRYEVIRKKLLEIKNEIDRTDTFICENINTVENFILPNIDALEGTIHELKSSKDEVSANIEEVTQAIEEFEEKIQDVFNQQNEKLNPQIIDAIEGEVSMEECEHELELMNNKIKNLEDEIKGESITLIFR